MADPNAAVSDTHPLLYHAAGGSRLGKRAARFFERCERREAILYVPAAVVWECSLLMRAGHVDTRRQPREFFEDLFSNPAYQPLDLSKDRVLDASELSFVRDPFDGLIVAAARSAGLPLVTRDVEIVDSGAVDVPW